jgi:hypothetical protein
VCIRRDMVPSAARTPTLSHSPEVAPLLIPSEDGPDARAVPPPLLGPPPFLRSGRPQREEGFFVDKTTNTHEKLFVFGRRGPALLMHAVKLLLFGSVIMLAVLLVELAGDILAVGAWLMILAVLPPLFVIIEAPNSIQTLNMVLPRFSPAQRQAAPSASGRQAVGEPRDAAAGRRSPRSRR